MLLFWLNELLFLWSQIVQILSPNKSRPEEVPVIGIKNVVSFKNVSDVEELYFKQSLNHYQFFYSNAVMGILGMLSK